MPAFVPAVLLFFSAPFLLRHLCLRRGVEGNGPLNSLPFFHVDKLIHLDVLQRIDLSAGPADLKQIYLLSLANAEVNTQIVLGDVAAAAAYFIDLRMRLRLPRHSRDAPNPRADAAAIRLHSDRAHFDPIVFRRRITAQQLRKIIHGIHDDIDIAVVVEISERTPTRSNRPSDSWSALQRHIVESAIA